MKCPKCNAEMESGVTTCPECGFSNTMDDGTPAQAPIVEAPVVPDNSAVVEAPVVDAPVVEAPAVEAPAVEAPAVEAPAVEAPVVDAPAVEAPAPKVDVPLVDAPSTLVAPNEEEKLEQNVQTPAAPAQESVKIEEVPHDETATSNVTEAPAPAPLAPEKEKGKKNIVLYIIIAVLVILAGVLVVLLIKNGPNSTKVAPVESKETTTNTNKTPEIKEKTPVMEEGFITLNNVKFSVPQDFAYEYLESAYAIYNVVTSDKRFILENMYVGTYQDIEQYLNLMKVEYPNKGCSDITVTLAEKDGYTYGIAEYMYKNTKFEEMFVLLDEQFVVVFVNTRTDLISTDEFIDYAISMTASARDIPATFDAGSNDIESLEYAKRTILAIDQIPEEETVETIVKD